MSVEAGDDVAQILNVDPEQLAQLLSESADGTAQLIDEHGNTITLTAEQFANAGFDVVGAAAAGGVVENQQYVQGEDGQIYMIENQQQLVTPKIQKQESAQQQPKTAADQQLIDDYRRLLQEKEQRLKEMEQKLKETTEQNVIMAHALVSTCKSQDSDLAANDDSKRQLVPSKKEISDGGKTPAVGSRAALESTIYRRSNDAFQIGFLPYPCDQCPRRFAQELHLKRHLEMAHAKRRPFYCQYCNRDLYLASDLHFQGHMRMQHKQEMEHEANLRHGIIEQNEPPPTQAAAFVPRETYEPELEPDWETQEEEQKEADEEEELKAVEGGDFKCTLCNKEYATMKGLKNHAKDEHGVLIEDENEAEEQPAKLKKPKLEKKFACDQCKKSFSRQEYLDKHKILHSDHFPFPCQYCAHKRFKWKENLLKHLNWHMERMPFKCTFCNQGFPSQIRLDLHQKTKHGHSKEGALGSAALIGQHQRDHACAVCQKTFFDKEVLAKHMRIHGGTVFPCPECDKKFISERFLRNHMTVHTQIRDFTCEKCGRFFNSANLLKAHRYLHGERPYKCRACKRTFRRSADLRSHEKIHTEIKSYMCDVCGRNFRSKVNLDLHMRVHQGLKPFQCSSCRKTFGKLEHLQVHVNAHKGVKPFPCPKCDGAFSTKAHLEQHMTLHQEGRKPFQCGACGSAYAKRGQLVKHLKSHTTNSEIQYVVIWEKGGALQEAVIVTDGVAQDATSRPPPPHVPLPPPIPLSEKNRALQHLEDMDNEPPRLQMMAEKRSAPAANQQPKETPAKVRKVEDPSTVTKTPVIVEQEEEEEGGGAAPQEASVLDTEALLALAEAQEDGTIYISEENLQALAQQGIIFSYQE